MPPRSSQPRYVLALLFVVYIFNFVDRNLLAILLQDIKLELGVSDTAMGFLTGTAFALFYTTAGIPIARLADRGRRTVVIALGLAAWSAMTAFSGLVRTFWQLALARVLVGVGEAAASPAAQSLLADYYPPERRATALAIYSMGANVGILLSLAGGGFIGQYFGWRTAFLVVGLPGLLLALLVWATIAEPERGAAEGVETAPDEAPSVGEAFAYLTSLPAFRHLVLAAGFYSCASYGFITWAPTFLIRVHGLSQGEAGIWSGLLVGGGGALGTYLGGRMSDTLGQRDPRWPLWTCAIGAATMTPFAIGFLWSPSLTGAIVLWVPAAVLGHAYVAPSFALTHALVKLRMRALATAMMLFSLNLLGLGLGPLLIGFANDQLVSRLGDEAIRYSLIGLLAFNLWAIVHSLLAARSLASDLERASEH